MNTLDKINNIKSTDVIDKLIFEKNLRINSVFVVKDLDIIVVVLNNKKILNISISQHPRLKNANKKQLENWNLIGGGIGIEWMELDEDLSLKGFIEECVYQRTLQTFEQEEYTFA